MSVHQRDDGRFIVVFKGTDGKRKERSFGRGPEAEISAKSFDASMKSRAIAPVVQQPLGPVLRQAVDAYLDHLGRKGKANLISAMCSTWRLACFISTLGRQCRWI